MNGRAPEESALQRDMRPLEIVRHAMLALVVADGRDLTARQITVLLTCYLEEKQLAVSDLAAHLKVSKPAITRAVDRLEELRLLMRADMPQDRRIVLVARTEMGAAFVSKLRLLMEGIDLDAAGAARASAPARHRAARRQEEPVKT
jgi:DNA-binding MarR family transcriptional regulator